MQDINLHSFMHFSIVKRRFVVFNTKQSAFKVQWKNLCDSILQLFLSFCKNLNLLGGCEYKIDTITTRVTNFEFTPTQLIPNLQYDTLL